LSDSATPPAETSDAPQTHAASAVVQSRPEIYANYALNADLSGFSEDQRKMLVLLIRASEIMDDLFWRQAYGDGFDLEKIATNKGGAYAPGDKIRAMLKESARKAVAGED